MDTGRLTKKERHELILSEVRKSAAIRISKLAKRIGVAGETIRRDLIELGEAGLINRTYGGATISLVTSEPVISERGLTLVEERARIGKGAAGLIENRQVVMIDGGSTTYEVARNLAQFKRDLVVITNSTGVASVAGGNPTFRVILCPGTYDNREGSVLGEDTVEFIARYNADAAIIGASGRHRRRPERRDLRSRGGKARDDRPLAVDHPRRHPRQVRPRQPRARLPPDADFRHRDGQAGFVGIPRRRGSRRPGTARVRRERVDRKKPIAAPFLRPPR